MVVNRNVIGKIKLTGNMLGITNGIIVVKNITKNVQKWFLKKNLLFLQSNDFTNNNTAIDIYIQKIKTDKIFSAISGIPLLEMKNREYEPGEIHIKTICIKEMTNMNEEKMHEPTKCFLVNSVDLFSNIILYPLQFLASI